LRATHLAPVLRRVASITALAAIDIAGVTAGLFAAFVLREIYYGRTIDWHGLWQAETDCLPFLILVTLLVFAQGNLYADRERRPGLGRIVSSLVLVALIALAFGLGPGHRFSTYGLAPTALALPPLPEMLGRGRRGIDYEFVGVLAPEPDGTELPVLGDLKALPRVLATHRVDEMILADSEFGERELLETVEQAHRRGVKVRIAPKTTELPLPRADYVPGGRV